MHKTKSADNTENAVAASLDNIAERITESVEKFSERDAYDINSFCARHSISRTMYFLLREKGRGPEEKRINDSRILITREAAESWRRKQKTGFGIVGKPDAEDDAERKSGPRLKARRRFHLA